jgi:hypothetical protein
MTPPCQIAYLMQKAACQKRGQAPRNMSICSENEYLLGASPHYEIHIPPQKQSVFPRCPRGKTLDGNESFRLFFRRPQTRAVLEAELDFGGREVFGKICAGDSRVVDRRAFEIDLPKIDAAQVGVAKVSVSQDDFAHVHRAKIDAAQIGTAEIDRFAPLDDLPKGVEFARPEAFVGLIVEKSRFVHG